MRHWKSFLAVLLVFCCVASSAQNMRMTDAEKAVVQVAIRKPDKNIIGFGTGFFVREDGVVATAFHVYSAAVQALSESRGGDIVVKRAVRQAGNLVSLTYAGIQLIAADPAHDLALLKIITKNNDQWNEVGGIGVITPCSKTELEPGTGVKIVGYFGSDMFPLTLGARLVGETTTTIFSGNDVEEFLVSGSAVPGQSGSPVILDDGSVAGVTLSIVTFSAPFNNQPLPSGLNRAAKAEFLQRLLSSLPK